MVTVTRTLKKGGDTGRLNRAEVRVVTAAIRAGRAADVVSGRVLEEFRAGAFRRNGGAELFGDSPVMMSARKAPGTVHLTHSQAATGKVSGTKAGKSPRK